MVAASIVPSDDLRNLRGTNYTAIPALDLIYLVPNWRMTPFDDLRMRQALALAVDRRALLRDVAREADLPTIRIVPSGLPQYNADLRDPAGRTGDAALTSDSVKALALDQSARSSQLMLTSWRADLPDTLAMLLSRLRTGGAETLGSASIPDADALLDQATAVSSSNGSSDLDQLIQAEQLYVTSAAWIPLSQGSFAQDMRSDVIDLAYSADQHYQPDDMAKSLPEGRRCCS
jgi:ABC-type oligopeptide transport system substrate-binding subunit